MALAKHQSNRDIRTKTRAIPRKRHLKAPPPTPVRHPGLLREVAAVVLVVLGLFIGLALYSFLSVEHAWELVSQPDSINHLPRDANLMGPVGARGALFLLRIFGSCSFVLAIWAFLLARSVWSGVHDAQETPSWQNALTTLSAAILLTVSSAVLAAVLFGFKGGGFLGTYIAFQFVNYINEAGTLLVSAAVFLLALGISTGLGFSPILRLFTGAARQGSDYLTEGGRLSKTLAAGSVRSAMKVTRVGANTLLLPLRVLPSRKDQRSEPGFDDLVESASSPNLDDGERNALDYLDFRNGEVLSASSAPPSIVPATSAQAADDLEQSDGPDDSHLIEEYDDDIEEEIDDDIPTISQRIRRSLKRTTRPTVITSSQDAAPKTSASRGDSQFELPAADLLVGSGKSHRSTPKQRDIAANSKRLEQTLLNFRIGGKVVEVHPGPVITLYQFEPAPGVKVQRIITLADDLALSLKVASVRVYAPVPGKGTVGIEVPNAEREIVRLRDLIESKDYRDPQHELALALGKDTFGDPFISDLSKMPHLLIAGATGTGKSVCINSLLLSLLYQHTPDELRLIMIDPKMLELSAYENIPHLKAPVVTQAKRARGVLWWAVEEMERRYELMKEVGVRSLASYNSSVATKTGAAKSGSRAFSTEVSSSAEEIIELSEEDVVAISSERPVLDRERGALAPGVASLAHKIHHPLPRIVIVVDELADLMLTVGREIEELLTRLAQKARAAGIHLILATQRPSVNVITGLIKANFPSRISFKVASRIDARTVLDNSGAEKLLGQGDMLFLSAGAGRPKRLHSPFVSDKEVHDVVEWLRSQGAPVFDAQIESMIERFNSVDGPGGDGEGILDEYDALYDQAVNLVIERGFASTSMVQRVFRIGYNRAARILETMEREGVVGPADGAKPRQVLVGGRTNM